MNPVAAGTIIPVNDKKFLSVIALVAGLFMSSEERDWNIGDMLEKYEGRKAKHGITTAVTWIIRDTLKSASPIFDYISETKLFKLLKAVGLYYLYKKFFLG